MLISFVVYIIGIDVTELWNISSIVVLLLWITFWNSIYVFVSLLLFDAASGYFPSQIVRLNWKQLVCLLYFIAMVLLWLRTSVTLLPPKLLTFMPFLLQENLKIPYCGPLLNNVHLFIFAGKEASFRKQWVSYCKSFCLWGVNIQYCCLSHINTF